MARHRVYHPGEPVRKKSWIRNPHSNIDDIPYYFDKDIANDIVNEVLMEYGTDNINYIKNIIKIFIEDIESDELLMNIFNYIINNQPIEETYNSLWYSSIQLDFKDIFDYIIEEEADENKFRR